MKITVELRNKNKVVFENVDHIESDFEIKDGIKECIRIVFIKDDEGDLKIFKEDIKSISTYEESEFEIKSREVYMQVKKFAHEFTEDDWKNEFLPKVLVIFSYYDNKIKFVCDYMFRNCHLYFRTREDAEKAIKAVGEEDFLKYYLGVRE